MVMGSLFFGWITTRLRAYQIRAISVCSVGLLAVLLVQGLMLCGTMVNPWCLALAFSFFGTSGAMNYTILTQHVPKHLTGRASTCFNLLIFLVAFVMQWGLGIIINHWTPLDGAYPAEAYQTAFGLCLMLQAGGLWMCATFKPWRRERRAAAHERQLP
jgi:MFS family permease